MKKITMEGLQSILESDQELAKRLEDYVGQEQGPNVQKKMKEFLKGEGYEIVVEKEELSADDLEGVSGGGGGTSAKCKYCGYVAHFTYGCCPFLGKCPDCKKYFGLW